LDPRVVAAQAVVGEIRMCCGEAGRFGPAAAGKVGDIPAVRVGEIAGIGIQASLAGGVGCARMGRRTGSERP